MTPGCDPVKQAISTVVSADPVTGELMCLIIANELEARDKTNVITRLYRVEVCDSVRAYVHLTEAFWLQFGVRFGWEAGTWMNFYTVLIPIS